MKPEWCPQEMWQAASMAVVHAPEYTQRLHEDVARALLSAKREGMEEASKLLDEGYSREVGHHYRKDRQPSKHDRCPHGRYTYEDCESCGAAAIRAKANEVRP